MAHVIPAIVSRTSPSGPPATVRLTEQLAATAGRTQFDAALNDCVDDIGRRSFPESAAELLGVVNLSMRFAEFRLAGN